MMLNLDTPAKRAEYIDELFARLYNAAQNLSANLYEDDQATDDEADVYGDLAEQLALYCTAIHRIGDMVRGG